MSGIKKHRFFISLSRRKCRQKVIQLKNRLRNTRHIYGGVFYDECDINQYDNSEGNIWNWSDIYFLGLRPDVLWNAEIITAQTAFNDVVGSLAFEEAYSLLNAHQREEEVCRESSASVALTLKSSSESLFNTERFPHARWWWDAASRLRCVSELLWLNAMLSWYNRVTDALTDICRQERFYFRPVAVGFCLTLVAARPGNLWQQQLTSLTALPPPAGVSSQALPLPDILLSGIPRHRGLSHWHRLCRQTGLITGAFLLLAMLASFMNNQRLVCSVGEHLTVWHRMSGYSSESKTTALQRLQADSQLLNDWQQRGVPQRYGLGLYQGMWLIPPVERAISEWVAPLSPRPVIQKVTQTPKTVRLNSLALFDAGKWTLKPGATKWLVNALVDIKAKAGWLIVVSGHTDNTGDPQRNQALSLKRAEAVRDWMRDTGDIPQSCFAVQGYGESRPVAPNDTAEGRARNRRVEISLVPQADACRLPDASPAPEEGASENITE